MSKPNIPNQRNEYKKLNARLNKYVLQVEDIYTAITEQAAQMATRVGYEGDGEFRFSDYPQIKAQVDEMAANYVADMENLIYAGTSAEWANSNLVQDLLVSKVLKAYDAQVSGEKYKVYYDPNSDALKSFQQRRDRGMNLSQRLWNQSSDMLTELEETLSTAIQKGMSAVTLAKRVSKYLQDFPSMQKDYTRKYGKATRSYDCEYRSIRLARSEINMAYRSSENERWRKLDFVVGYEIKVSHKHTVPDICDDLEGKYPKDFEWVGWHPNCTDYKIPILKTEDEFFSIDDKPSVNEVKDVPDSFKQWVRDNQASIKRAEARGTAPYFVRDNRKVIDIIMQSDRERVAKFVMTEKAYSGLKERGIRFSGFDYDMCADYETTRIKGFDLISFDDFMQGLCNEYGIKIRKKEVTRYGRGNVQLSYIGRDQKGEDFEIRRNFIEEEGRRTVEHALFVVPEELQGNGLSKRVSRHMFAQYEKMGIECVSLTANIDVGGYAWAKYGFSAKKSAALEIVEEAYKRGAVDKEKFDYIADIIGSEKREYFPMDQIANMEEGKKILLNTQWKGIFLFEDNIQLSVLRDYIGF